MSDTRKPNPQALIKRGALGEPLEPNREVDGPKVQGKQVRKRGFKTTLKVEEVKPTVLKNWRALEKATSCIGTHPKFDCTLNALKQDVHVRTPHTKWGKPDQETGETLRDKKLRQAEEILLIIIGGYLAGRESEFPIAVELSGDTDKELHYLNSFIKHLQFVKILTCIGKKGERGTKGNPPNAYTINPLGNTQLWQELFAPLVDLAVD